ncbi:MAG: M15 family metallopeptidase [Lachnospiraceae bacterium]|nr:M15 family metallopeptidase [Lachnospiraceae bacterium]
MTKNAGKTQNKKRSGHKWEVPALLLLLFFLTAGCLRLFFVLSEEYATAEKLQEELQLLKQGGEALQGKLDAIESISYENSKTGNQTGNKTEEVPVTPTPLPVYRTDIEELPAGTILSEQEVDRGNTEQYFRCYEIAEGDEVYRRINGKSYVKNKHIKLEELRYIKVLHYNFDKEIQVGELIVHAELAEVFRDIFHMLFRNEYEIYSMFLVDDFWTGDGATTDEASMQANNTSAFCYRTVTDSKSLSNHALGRAIDINPLQNPYVGHSGEEIYYYPENAEAFTDRSLGETHMITNGDLCYRLFTDYGFTWGGNWNKIQDYQHFEKEK